MRRMSRDTKCNDASAALTPSATCDMQKSAARSQAAHRECRWVGGKDGSDIGVQPAVRMILSARRKFRKILATIRS